MLISRKFKSKSYTNEEPSRITEIFVKEQIFCENLSSNMSNKEQKKERCYHKLVDFFFQHCGAINVVVFF